MSELNIAQSYPSCWHKCRLGDALTLVNGRAYKRHEMIEQGTPILRIQNLNGGENWYYSDLQLPENKYCVKDDLLYAWSATFGPYWSRWEKKLIYHYHIWKVMPSIAIKKEFAFYELWRITEDLKAAAHGVAMPHITKDGMENWEIVLPPLAEQHQIAAKLDELLAQVDSIKTRLDAIPKILKRFRKSVLAAAVSGKLTEDWRGSASIDFNQSPVTIGVESDTAPKGWNWQKLVDLAILESGHTPRKSVSEYWKNGDVYWICLQDIRAAHGSIINDTLHKPTMLGIDNSSARLLPAGTVCFSRDISVGYTTIMGKEMSTTQHFANWICGDSLNNKFLMFALMAAREHLLISGQGTTVKTIYMPALKEFRLLTPPLKEQSEIVRRVEQLFAYADQIEQRVKDAQARVNHLTQAILAKAFRGELTADWRAQNLDLISGENSAEALLAKIQTERPKEKPRTDRKTRA